MGKNEIDMTEGPLLGKMVRFTLPLVASGMLQLLFNACDTMVVGKFVGDSALAAVGSNGALISLLIGLFMGVSVGANVLVAQFYGAKRQRDIEEVVHTAFLIAVIFGVGLTAIGIAFAPLFLRWTGVPEDVIGQSTRYLRIYFLGCVFSLVYNFMAAILRAIGDTRRPLIILTIAGVVNLMLNLLLVIGFGMDVEGVAIPTVVSQFVSAGLVVLILTREKSIVRLDLRRIRIVPDKLKKMLRIGIPSGLQGIVFSLSNVLIQSSVNSFGKYVMAGVTAANNLEGFVYQAMNAFHHTALNFTGQNVGAVKPKRIIGVYWRAALLVTAIGATMGGLIWFFGPKLLTIYTTTDQSIAAGMTKLMYVCAPYFICGLMDVSSGMVKGLGASIIPMVTALTGSCLFRILYLYTFFAANRTLETLYLVYPISWTITAVAHLICFLILFRRIKKRWAKGRESLDAQRKRHALQKSAD
ncbi:MAG: MATE family efflux transporter [Lachnospiraceae bacterium]|nr:MATE family efflux transporter [Lachnospiraceae bacterium]